MNELTQRPAAELATRLLDVIDNDIAPLTRTGVRRGDKIFGAAVLRKSDLSLVVAGTNEETLCPLWHGEVVTIRRFHELPRADRPAARDCLFLSTHEPCSLCLSAIAWAGFDNFYYLFSYQDSRDDFSIPHDLEILEQIFGCANGSYKTSNAYWQSRSIRSLIESLDHSRQVPFEERLRRLSERYARMSADYQASKGTADIPLA